MNDDLHQAYEEACANLHDLGFMVEGLVKSLLENAGLRTHSVTHRIKTQESVRRKLDSKEMAISGLGEIHDLLGLRVITFFPDEVDRVAAVIKKNFKIDTANSVDKRALLDPDRFGYLSLHYVASLSKKRLELPENEKFKGRKFEIQIRSILQHAWAEIEHDLGYHAASTIPDAVRRRFSRLAGLLEIGDDEFERLRDDVVRYQAAVGEEVISSPEGVQVNRDSIAAIIASDPTVNKLDGELARIATVGLVPGHERVPNARTEELSILGFETIGEVVGKLKQVETDLLKFFSKWSEARVIDHAYPGMCLFILAYFVAASRGKKPLMKYLEESGLTDNHPEAKSLADEILAVYSHSVA